jgi:hypothetical protein
LSRAAGILICLALCACASAPAAERCFVQDEPTARQIAALVSGMSADDGSLQVADEGDHWRVGKYAETWLEGETIMSRDAGFEFRIDKCTGSMSGYRTWP